MACFVIAECGVNHDGSLDKAKRLIDAAKTGNASAVTSLLRQRVPVDAKEPDGTTALHWAARLDRVDIVQALLRAKAPVNAATRYGVTPLTLAAINGSAPVVDLLLEAGADPNTTGADGETVLMLAARTGRPEAVRLLLEKGANVNARETWQGKTALMWAAAENHGEVVSLLAKAGADLNAKSTIPEFPKVKVDAATMVFTAMPKGGFTALLLSARQGAGDGESIGRHVLETHSSTEDVGRMAAEAKVKTVVLYHLLGVPGPRAGGTPEDAFVPDVKKHFNGEVIVGNDQMRI